MSVLDFTVVNQRELARRIGVSHGEISRIFAGKRTPTISTIRAIASALDVETGEVVDSLPLVRLNR